VLIKALTTYAAQFFVEVGAHGDKQEALKRSGLYYLLQLEQFHEPSTLTKSPYRPLQIRPALHFEGLGRTARSGYPFSKTSRSLAVLAFCWPPTRSLGVLYRQSHTKVAKAPDNQAPAARKGLMILCPSRSHANADSANASVMTPAAMSSLAVEFGRSAARSSMAVRYLRLCGNRIT
jgi:hypothetical protein